MSEIIGIRVASKEFHEQADYKLISILADAMKEGKITQIEALYIQARFRHDPSVQLKESGVWLSANNGEVRRVE